VANTGFQVSPEQLQLAASQVERGAAKIKTAVDDVMRIIDGIASDWTGSAQEQFSNLCASWSRSANELEKSILGIATLMSNAADAYRQAESQVSKLFGADGGAGASGDDSAPAASPFSGLGPRPRDDKAVGASTGES
jgi:WXG100 family type VII secretion target